MQKKNILLSVFFLGFSFLVQGQANFDDFLKDFPLMSGDFTWTGEDLEKARTSGKKIQGAKLFFITDGQTALGEYFPLGRIEVSGTNFVFWAYHTGTYDAENTQIHLCSRAYDKKGKPVDVTQNYMASNGGVKDKFDYSFEAIFNSKKNTLYIDQKTTDKPMASKTIYSFSKKGYGFKNAN
ncbi:MAG: hypothetical protein ACK40K_09790 [Raineya sp.]